MRVRAYFEERLKTFQQLAPDIADMVAEDHRDFTAGKISAEEFAKRFNRADVTFAERATAPRKRKQPVKKKQEEEEKKEEEKKETSHPPVPRVVPTEPPKMNMVKEMRSRGIPVENTPEMEETLQFVRRYAWKTIMDAINRVLESRHEAKLHEETHNVQKELEELARREELAHILPTPPVVTDDEVTNAKKRQREDTNITALAMIPKKALVIKPASKRATQVPQVTKEHLILALIHLSKFDGILGRSSAVLNRLSFGI